MSIEDVLGYPGRMSADGPLLGPLDHGPDDRCGGRDVGLLREDEEATIEVAQEVEIEGEALLVKTCLGCGKTWYERKGG